MEYVFKELTKEEIFEFTLEQAQKEIKKIKETYEKLSKISESIFLKKINDIFATYDIKSIKISPYYTPDINKKSYIGHYTIIINNNSWQQHEIVPKKIETAKVITFNKLKEKIYDELSPLSYFVRKEMFFNANEIKDKSTHFKLEKNFSEKNFLHTDNKTDCIFRLTKEKISRFNLEQLQKEIIRISKLYEALSRMSEILLEKRTGEIAINYDIKTIDIIPYFLISDHSKNYAIKIDDMRYEDYTKIVPKFYEHVKDITFFDLIEQINNEIMPLKFILKKEINIDVLKFRVEYMYYKLEKNIQTKTSKIKPSCCKI